MPLNAGDLCAMVTHYRTQVAHYGRTHAIGRTGERCCGGFSWTKTVTSKNKLDISFTQAKLDSKRCGARSPARTMKAVGALLFSTNGG